MRILKLWWFLTFMAFMMPLLPNVVAAEKDEQFWDKQLNQEYQKLFKQLNTKAQKSLKVAQQKWIKFRDAEFSMLTTLYPEKGDKASQLHTRATIVENRVSELKSYLAVINEVNNEATLAKNEAPEGEKHPIDQKLETCLSNDETTLAMLECNAKAEKQWDDELNTVYNKLVKVLNDALKNSLKSSQKQWISFRDAEFEVIGDMYVGDMFGTMHRVIASSDRVELVKARVLTLQNYLNVVVPK